MFGGDANGAFMFFVNGPVLETCFEPLAVSPDISWVLSDDTTLTRCAWFSNSADTSTEIAIYVDGVFNQSFFLSGVSHDVVLLTPIVLLTGQLVGLFNVGDGEQPRVSAFYLS